MKLFRCSILSLCFFCFLPIFLQAHPEPDLNPTDKIDRTFLHPPGLQHHHHEQKPTRYIIYQQNLGLRKGFFFESRKGILGRVEKRKYNCLRNSYVFLDSNGHPTMRTYFRMLKLTPKKVLDVFDGSHKMRIGTILECIWTGLWDPKPAVFNFFNSRGNLVGVAIMDEKRTAFTIYDPNDYNRIIAIYNRRFISNETDYWTLEIQHPEPIDLELLTAFGAYAIDFQGEYREDI